jgi:hypothetical protein
VLTLQDVVDGLETAARDPRVKGIIATVGTSHELAIPPVYGAVCNYMYD